MFKRFNRSNLNKFLGHEAAPSEVTSSHVYGRVAKSNPPVHRAPRRKTPARPQVVAGYRDSMVGSVAQYRDRAPIAPQKPEETTPSLTSDGVIGNRPKVSTDESKTASAADRRRHHFVEPPKRNFHRFD